MAIIATWNSRGNPIKNNRKEGALDHMIAQCDFVLLQECGDFVNRQTYVYDAQGHTAYVYGKEQAGNKNIRCSTAIVSRHLFQVMGEVYLQSGTGRYAIVAEHGGVLIASLHAEAGCGEADRNSLLAELTRKFGTDRPIIIGGDWNCAPPQALVLVGSQNRGTTWEVVACRQATHTNGSELDYFLHFGNVKLSSGPIKDADNYSSDHYPIVVELQ